MNLLRWNLLFFLSLMLLMAAFPARSRADVLKISINDTIHPITEEFIERAIDEAKAHNDQAVLIELQTPGGLLESTHNIIEKILASPVPVIVFVTPSGSRAASAGFFILEAADVAAMSPGTNTGAAHPVAAYGKVDDVMKQKMENDAAAFMRSYVSKRGRNVEVAESAVRESKSFTEQEALSQKIIEYVASDDADLMKQLDGKAIHRFDGSSVTLHTAGVPLRNYGMSLRQRLQSYLLSPDIIFILFAVGMLALYAEFNHPGAIVPAVVGIICILIAVFALNLLPTRYTALALILSSFIFFALEAKYQTHGLLGACGTVAIVLGGIYLVDGPIPEMRVHLVTALAVALPLGLITVMLMTLVIRSRKSKYATGVEGLVGQIALVRTPLEPTGKVVVQGVVWDAVSAPGTTVHEGDRARVKSVSGLQLEVEPEQPAKPS